VDYILIILLKALSVPEYRVLDTRTDALIQVLDKALRNQNNLSFMGGCIVAVSTIFLLQSGFKLDEDREIR